MFPADGIEIEPLMQHADVAMYVAKDSHSGLEFYRPEHDRFTPERLALMGALPQAIDHGELVLHYQPKLDLGSDSVSGVEVLLRWQHPERGLLAPGDFIPLAENTELIKPLTAYVLDRALEQCRRWEVENGLVLSVAVNISVRHLLDWSLPELVGELLEKWERPPARLELEITETSLMVNPQRSRAVLGALSELGVTLAIDDFGTGYSSLGYLKQIPLDVIKIDQSFVLAMATSPDDRAIVRSTVELGHNLGLVVVAEGVETEDALQQLRAFGCDLAQGFHLGEFQIAHPDLVGGAPSLVTADLAEPA
jgi:EAL domain-containing protein (putative c-di-GMP-specific phosphodiesterase class I)